MVADASAAEPQGEGRAPQHDRPADV